MKYDLGKIAAKLTSNTIPKSMAGFDMAAYVRLHSARREETRIIRPSAVQEIFNSRLTVIKQ